MASTLLETADGTFESIPSLLTDRTYRLEIAERLTNCIVRDVWYNEFDKYSPAFRAIVIAPLQNKVGALLTDPTLRRFFTEPGDLFDIRCLMEEGEILVVNLDKGRLGESGANLIGSLVLSHIGLAALSRRSIHERARRDFTVYLDEFQAFTTLSLANMLAEMRNFRVAMMLSTQSIQAIAPAIRDAVDGNAGTILTFRVGAADANYLSREFASVFSSGDLTGLERYHVAVRLLVDGEPSRPFSAQTLGDADVAMIMANY